MATKTFSEEATLIGEKCLYCRIRKARQDSKFCCDGCKTQFSLSMPEAIACRNESCTAQADGVLAAMLEGWREVESDPEGTTWNYLGICPDCIKEGREDEEDE